MALNIKDRETEKLAAEVAAMAGETRRAPSESRSKSASSASSYRLAAEIDP
jgi:hypothetical protein